MFQSERQRPLVCECLESRRLLASFGTPWPEPRALTVSFPSDQAKIGAYDNQIRETFDSVADRREWQTAALRAFQTWAVEANLNIGLTTDRGDHLGAVGLSQGDPRFGDFRIGAFPQQGVLANALPYQTIAGTWAGDLLLNTQVNYFLDDGEEDESEVEVPQTNEKGPAIELFSVLLHEAGNALGLEDNDLPGAVLNGNYSGPNSTLKPSDVAALQELYGSRQDIYEVAANDARSQATPITYPNGFDGTQPVSVMGSLNDMNDVDYYRLETLEGQDRLTVRLWASGISLVKSHLQVLDHHGQIIADVKANDIFKNNLELEIGLLERHEELFIRVERNADDVFAIGDYRIDVDYRPPEQQPSIVPPAHDGDAVEEEDDDDGEDDDVNDLEDDDDESELVDVIFAEFGLVDQETGSNDLLTSATTLDPTQGFLTGTRYEALGALTLGDVDYFSFRTADVIDGPLSVKLETIGSETPILHADVLDGSGNRVAARANPRPDGSISFQVFDPLPSTEFFIRLQVAPASLVSEGNYIVTIDAAAGVGVGGALLNSTAVSGSANWTPIWVARTQLFRFDLSITGQRAQAGVAVAIYDPRFATVVTSFAVAGNQAITEFEWLQRGKYFVRVEGLDRDGALQRDVGYDLSAAGISDDQGPLLDNPVDPYGGSSADPYAGGNPDPAPYGGGTPVIYPLPDPYGGSNPFQDPNSSSPDPYGGYEYIPNPDPWYGDPYYDLHYDIFLF